jgi:branched-chain amino acid transport system permease protein
VGGVYTMWGALVAAFLLEIVPDAFTVWGVSTYWSTVLFGIGVLQVLTTAPGGIAGQLPRDLAKLGQTAFALARPKTPARGRAR